MTELETVLATLHRTAAAMAAEARPPARIRLGAAGVTLEWDLLRVGETVGRALGAASTGAALDGSVVPAPADPVPAGPVPAGPVSAGPVSAGPVSAGPVSESAALPAAAEAAGRAGAVATARHVLSAPTVGVFYRSAEPGAAPFVDTGDLVRAGQQVGIVEAMKLMIPVEADRGGRVVDVLCADATAVEFGAPLFALAEG